MQIEETFSVKAPIQKLWDSLLDPEIVGPCIPGCEKVETINNKEYDRGYVDGYHRATEQIYCPASSGHK